jgi:hypothetical protein
MLAVTPAAAAVVGTLIAQYMPYGVASIALSVAGAMLVIRLLRSPIVPAISAGFLPVAVDVTSWWYPVSIAAVTGVLALAAVIYQRFVPSPAAQPKSAEDEVDDELERAPAQYTWVPVFAGFLLLAYGLSTLTGLRLILFPPLAVIAFEMFAHADVCPWAGRPYTLPLACTITAAVGVAAVFAFGVGAVSVVIALLAGIVALRALRLHLPPALAIGLLPQVIPNVDWHFVLAVAIGTGALTAAFLCFQSMLTSQTRPAKAP